MTLARQRRLILTDARPRWNDPDLKCVRDYLMPNGVRQTEIDPEYEQRYRAHMVDNANAPGWRTDPTYNMRRKA